MKNGDILNVEISDLGMNGEGIAKLDDFVVFAPFALPGETAEVQIEHVKKNLVFAKLKKILTESPDRVPPRCPHFTICGGCDIQQMSADLQADFKQKTLENTLKKQLKGRDFVVEKTVSGKNLYKYRNKLQLPFGIKNGQVRLGFFKKLSHDIVPLESCPLHADWSDKLVAAVTDWANSNKISVYNEKTGKGFLRHLVARNYGTLSVTVVANGRTLNSVDSLSDRLKKTFSSFRIYFSQNQKNTNVIMGDTVHLLTSHGENTFKQFGLDISPMSFLQVNNEISGKIYEKTAELTASSDVVIDVYSGIGIMTAEVVKNILMLKDKAADTKKAENEQLENTVFAYGIEIVKEAIDDANEMQKALGLEKYIENICGDAAIKLPELALNLSKNKVLNANSEISVILDPPRKGCDEGVLSALKTAAPDKIVYISCNPATLARDLHTLTLDDQYQISSVTPYDMFPQTKHVETLACLKRK